MKLLSFPSLPSHTPPLSNLVLLYAFLLLLHPLLPSFLLSPSLSLSPHHFITNFNRLLSLDLPFFSCPSFLSTLFFSLHSLSLPLFLLYFSFSQGAELRLDHAIKQLFPNGSGTRLVVVDNSGGVHLFNPVTGECALLHLTANDGQYSLHFAL